MVKAVNPITNVIRKTVTPTRLPQVVQCVFLEHKFSGENTERLTETQCTVHTKIDTAEMSCHYNLKLVHSATKTIRNRFYHERVLIPFTLLEYIDMLYCVKCV